MKMHEAKDNVKFLYTLDRFFRVMEKSSPVKLYLLFVKKTKQTKNTFESVFYFCSPSAGKAGVLQHVPQLMSSIRLIYSVSQYYNTSERMTSLLLKVTNQMISTCKSHLTQGAAHIWDLSR